MRLTKDRSCKLQKLNTVNGVMLPDRGKSGYIMPQFVARSALFLAQS